MLENVIAAYKGTEACRVALQHAAAIAQRAGATLHLVSVGIPVTPIGGFGWVAPYEDLRPTDELIRERAAEGAACIDAEIEVVPHPRFGNPAAEIVRLASETHAGLIVMGDMKHTALERIFLGSTVDRVVRISPVPCLVAASATPAARILVAADDSVFSENALHAAVTLSALFGAELCCLHVVAPPSAEGVRGELEDLVAPVKEHFERFVSRLAAEPALPEGPSLGSITTRLRTGDVGEEILAEAREQKVDLIAVGTHGRGFFQRAILGSISEELLRRAPVSLLIAPGPPV
ncbi:MAG: universal stress protein [Planctomycetota bacterium]